MLLNTKEKLPYIPRLMPGCLFWAESQSGGLLQTQTLEEGQRGGWVLNPNLNRELNPTSQSGGWMLNPNINRGSKWGMSAKPKH